MTYDSNDSNDVWIDGIHLVKDGKVLSASNFINNFNYFLGNTQTQDPGMQVF